MAVQPDHGYLADRVHLTLNVREDLGPQPTVYFSLPQPTTRVDITVVAGSVRQTAHGRYELDVVIDARAMPRTYTVVVTKQPGWSRVAGQFTVRAAYRIGHGILPRRHTLTLALPTATVPAPTPTPAATPIAAAPAGNAAQRILDAEADVLRAIARIAPDHVHDPCWLRAAAKKESAAAKVIDAVSSLGQRTRGDGQYE